MLAASTCLAQNHLLRQLAQEDFLPTLGNVGFGAREKGQQINKAGKAVLEPVTAGVLGSASHFLPSSETQISTPLPRLPSWVLVGTQERGGGDNTQTAESAMRTDSDGSTAAQAQHNRRSAWWLRPRREPPGQPCRLHAGGQGASMWQAGPRHHPVAVHGHLWPQPTPWGGHNWPRLPASMASVAPGHSYTYFKARPFLIAAA